MPPYLFHALYLLKPGILAAFQPYRCPRAPVELDAGAGFSSYIWQDGSTGRFYTAMAEGTYSVQVTDANGCHAGASVLMKNCSLNLFVPNAFSPNGDGINDRFQIRPNIDEITEFSMVVFNRSGELLFETYDVGTGWDGTYKGQPCPQDTYVWMVTWQAPGNIKQNSPTTMKGTFVLLR
jgi:gliding motility-associated-like protein